jgi:DNA-binding GntR family transcriptional regulator
MSASRATPQPAWLRAGGGLDRDASRAQILSITTLSVDLSVADLAYAALRHAILEVDIYRASTELRIDEKRLADDLGVSRTPVREALVRLEHEGIVRIVPRRGVYIVRKSKAEIVEIITVWAALEGMAARQVTLRATDAEIRTLRELFATFEDGEVRSHLDEYSAANLSFHQRIIELAHSELLASMADRLLIHVRAIRRHTIGDRDRPDRSIVDHIHIIEALERRESELAERLVRDHALNLASHVEKHVAHLD